MRERGSVLARTISLWVCFLFRSNVHVWSVFCSLASRLINTPAYTAKYIYPHTHSHCWERCEIADVCVCTYQTKPCLLWQPDKVTADICQPEMWACVCVCWVHVLLSFPCGADLLLGDCQDEMGQDDWVLIPHPSLPPPSSRSFFLVSRSLQVWSSEGLLVSVAGRRQNQVLGQKQRPQIPPNGHWGISQCKMFIHTFTNIMKWWNKIEDATYFNSSINSTWGPNDVSIGW